MTTDSDFLGLTSTSPGSYRFTVDPHLARLDGRLYGGTAIAVSIATAELVSERPAVWMTTQFVSTAPAHAEISVHAEVLASGRRTSQLRVTGSDSDGEVMFASLGATGHRRPDGLSGTFEHPPEVDPPAESAVRGGPFSAMLRNAGVEVDFELPRDVGFNQLVEFREPELHSHPDPGPGRLCMWTRRRDGEPLTPAIVAFIADMVPLSVAHGCGVVGGGISLDNTIRIGTAAPSEWVLVDLRAHFVEGNYGHGVAHIWNESGELLATASQSAAMFRIDMGNAPWQRD